MSNELVPQKYDREIADKKQETIQVEDDFDYARENLYGVLHQGQAAIAEMIEIAKQSQHPAAYETVTKMLKVQSDLAKSLLKIHSQKKEVKETSPEPQQQTSQQKLDVQGDVVQNKIVYATTEEMAKMLSGDKEEEDV